MAENSDNLVLEHLRHIRTRVDSHDKRMEDLVAQFQVSNAHVGALVQHENYAMTKFTELETRLQRVERRLELRDDENK